MSTTLKKLLLNKRLVFIFVVFTILAVAFNVRVGTSDAASPPAPASFFPEIRKTGVDTNNNKRPNADAGNHDYHWTISKIFNDAGRRTCQADNGDNGGRYAILVEEFGTGAGQTTTGAHPWATSSAARWIGLGGHGLHEGNGSGSIPAAGDPNYCYDSSYTGAPIHNPAHTTHWPGGPPLQVQDDSHIARWNTYVFNYQNINVDPLVINSKVDMQSVKLTMRGIADNLVGVVINGVPMDMENCPFGSQSTGAAVYGQPVEICDYGFSSANQQFSARVPAGTNPFPDGKIYSIQILVKSTRDLVGVILTEIQLEGDLKNTNPIGTVDIADCDRLEGWAFDPDDPSRQLDIAVTADAGPGQPGAIGVGTFKPDTDGVLEANEYKVIVRDDVADAFGIPRDPPHGFQIPKSALDPFADAYPRTFNIYAVDVPPPEAPDTPGQNTFIAQRVIGPCAPPTCNNNLTLDPAIPEANQTYSSEVGFNYSPGAQGRPMRYDVNIDMPGAANGNQTSSDDTTSTSATKKFGNMSQGSDGSYTADWRVRWTTSYSPNTEVSSGNSRSINCSNNYTVAKKPYLKVYGNDVAAGGVFKELCSAADLDNPEATILSYTQALNSWAEQDGSLPENWTGGSGQFASFALGEIVDFFSAGLHSPRQNNASTNRSTSVHGLTFGNYNTDRSIENFLGDPSPNILNNKKVIRFGGQGGQVNCVPDFFGQAAATGAPVSNGNVVLAGANVSGPTARFINGNALISSDITTNSTSWASVNNIPSYYLVVKGNIYITAGVSQLDGVFIAQPRDDGSGGKIYTCSPPNPNGFSRYPAGQLYNACNTKLTINGAFIAKQVKFLRTNGSLSKGSTTSSQPRLTLQWSNNGVIAGADCLHLLEAADPDSWHDNYLCSPAGSNYGLQWSSIGPIAGMDCTQILEGSDPNTWDDNYICAPSGSNYGLQWSSIGPIAGMGCTRFLEGSDPNSWADNYLCVPVDTTSSSPYVNETAGSGNIAEVFNFSQESYLAPLPSSLIKSSSYGSYDFITSLPPVL